MLIDTGNKNKQKKISIDQLILKIKETDHRFSNFKRIPQKLYSIEECMQLIEAIGKHREPAFVIDENNQFAYTNFVKWCNADETMQAIHPETGDIVAGRVEAGIYLGGSTGSGKSLCLDVMQIYCRIMGLEIMYENEKYPLPLSWSNHRADEIAYKFTQDGNIAPFRNYNIIGIQDLGQEPTEVAYMGNKMNCLAKILEFRGDRSDAITLITSNLPSNKPMIVKVYGDRVQSRIFEMCNYLVMKGDDRRKSKICR